MRVVGASEPGERIQEEDDVGAGLHHALRALDGQVGDAQVALDVLVVGRGPDLGGHAALEIGDFLGPLIDEQDHHMALGMVFQHAQGDIAEQRGLAGAGRRDDQAAGALAERAEQIYRAGGQAMVLHLELQLLVGRDGGQLGEIGQVAARIDVEAVDLLDEAHLRVGKAAVGRGRGGDHAALFQLEPADQFPGHEGIGGTVLAVAREVQQRAGLVVVEVEDALDAHHVLGWCARADGCRRGSRGGRHRIVFHNVPGKTSVCLRRSQPCIVLGAFRSSQPTTQVTCDRFNDYLSFS